MNSKELNKDSHLKKLLSLKPEVSLLGPNWDSQTELFTKEGNIPYNLVLNCSFEKLDLTHLENLK